MFKKRISKCSIRIEKESKLSEIAASTLNSRFEKSTKNIDKKKTKNVFRLVSMVTCNEFRLSGRADDPGQAEREFKSPCLCFYAFFFGYCCTAVVRLYTHGGFVVRGLVDGFFCCVLLCFTAAVLRTAVLQL